MARRNLELSEEEKQDVSKIVQEESQKTGLKNVQNYLEQFFVDIRDELAGLKELLKTGVARAKQEFDYEGDPSDVAAIVEMMGDEDITGEISEVDHEEEEEADLSSTIEKLEEIQKEQS